MSESYKPMLLPFIRQCPWRTVQSLWLLFWCGFFFYFLASFYGPGHGLEMILLLVVSFIGLIGHVLMVVIYGLVRLFCGPARSLLRHPYESATQRVWLIVWIAGGGYFLFGVHQSPNDIPYLIFCAVLPVAMAGHVLVSTVMALLHLANVLDQSENSMDSEDVTGSIPAQGNCGQCGHPVLSDYRFCPECGAGSAQWKEGPADHPGPGFWEFTITPATVILGCVLSLLILVGLVIPWGIRMLLR